MFILYAILTALCLCIGFYFGFKIGRTNELPKIQRKHEKVQARKEDAKIKKFEKALNNMDNYNGTSQGQEEI